MPLSSSTLPPPLYGSSRDAPTSSKPLRDSERISSLLAPTIASCAPRPLEAPPQLALYSFGIYAHPITRKLANGWGILRVGRPAASAEADGLLHLFAWHSQPELCFSFVVTTLCHLEVFAYAIHRVIGTVSCCAISVAYTWAPSRLLFLSCCGKFSVSFTTQTRGGFGAYPGSAHCHWHFPFFNLASYFRGNLLCMARSPSSIAAGDCLPHRSSRAPPGLHFVFVAFTETIGNSNSPRPRLSLAAGGMSGLALGTPPRSSKDILRSRIGVSGDLDHFSPPSPARFDSISGFTTRFVFALSAKDPGQKRQHRGWHCLIRRFSFIHKLDFTPNFPHPRFFASHFPLRLNPPSRHHQPHSPRLLPGTRNHRRPLLDHSYLPSKHCSRYVDKLSLTDWLPFFINRSLWF